MDTKQFGAKTMKLLADNAVEIGAGAATVAGGVALAKAGPVAVTTACLVGGGVVAAFVTFHAARGMISAAIAAPAAATRMYHAAKDRMERPEVKVATA